METIRKATENDIKSVVNIYENVIDHDINVKKTVGWKHGIYPTEDTARTGLAADDLYVMEDGIVPRIGSMRFRMIRCWCFIRWRLTRRRRGVGTGRGLSRFTRGSRGRAAARSCGWTRTV